MSLKLASGCLILAVVLTIGTIVAFGQVGNGDGGRAQGNTAKKDDMYGVTIQKIESPGCFLPGDTSQANELLHGLLKTSSWRIIGQSNPINSSEQQVLAYRRFEDAGKTQNIDPNGYAIIQIAESRKVDSYLVALIQLPNSELDIEVPIRSEHVLSTICTLWCNKKSAKLKTTYFPEGDMTSTLLVKNKRYGLLIFEGSWDRERKFTKRALEIASKEIASALKGK